MRSVRLALFLTVLIATAGCKGSTLEGVPETPPPGQAPAVPFSAALRPLYQMGGKAPVGAGTAFVIQDGSARLYMLTAAHVMDNDAEWQQVQGVALRAMGADEVAKVQGRPLHVGKPFDSAGAGADLVIWPLAEESKVAPLKLASADAKRNEWVWAVGQEPGSSGPQKLYRCKVTGAQAGGLVLQQHDRFEMRGFSGGPVVNAQGEVVGSLLGGRAPTVLIARVGSIRERLTQAGVQVP